MTKYITHILLIVVITLMIMILLKPVDTPVEQVTEKVTVTAPPPQVTVIDRLSTTPPYRQYKPKRFQQMGLLSNATETLPLFGRETPHYRDRYNYYTNTPGEQAYALPVTVGDRDCTEDIGCPELYDNQTASVFGRPGTYDVAIYRVN
jgi:hypothetical protein